MLNKKSLNKLVDEQRLNRYFSRNHQWIIGILIAIIIPLVIYALQKNDSINLETKAYYFVNYQQRTYDAQKLKAASCWTSSISSNRSDAFRCSVGNYIYDPCFAGSSDIISCPSDPISKTLTLFRLESEPPNYNRNEKTEAIPWFIVLQNKQRCEFYTGATDFIADRRIDYGCNKGKYDFLQLPIIKEGKEWKLGCHVGDRIEFCSIKETWY